MEEISRLHLELHKLSCVESQETLDSILCSLWKSRKTGLRGPDKSHLQSLLHLSSLSQLDPVLACLRSLVRKCAYQNFTGDELLKLFPPDLPLDLQSMLLLSFQKNQAQWKEDVSREQDFSPRTSVSYQVRTNAPPSFTSLPSAEMQMPPSLWPRQDDSLAQLNHNDFGISTPLVADVDVSGLPASFQCDAAPAENLANLPCLKSMTWTMENRGASPADRVAVICLKLHDYSKSPLGETEVKFQLTRDTLEAMLRSMTYISEQLSAARTSSGPFPKLSFYFVPICIPNSRALINSVSTFYRHVFLYELWEDSLHSYGDRVSHFGCFSSIWSSKQAITARWASFSIASKRPCEPIIRG